MTDRLIIITGPTASGKSDIAINLARKINSQIISSDSQQIYRDMDIGTNKTNNLFDIDHHMINIIDPDDNYSVEEFSKESKSIIKKLNENGIIPIIAGGTGFYIDSILFDLNYGSVEKDQAYRDSLIEEAKDKPNNYLHDKLKNIDEITSNKYHPNEKNRIIRALEIYKKTGKPPSIIRKGEKILNKNIKPIIFFLNYNNRQYLYNKINTRVLKMIDEGLVDEVKYLINKYNLDSSSQSMAAIGYKEVLSYLNEEINMDDMIDLIQKNTRHYAKRQITWMKRYMDYNFTHEILMDNITKEDASDIILQITKDVYGL